MADITVDPKKRGPSAQERTDPETYPSEAHCRAVLGAVPYGVIVVDEAGLIRIWNAAAERAFGWKDEEVVGKNVSVLMPEPYAAEHDGYIHDYLESGIKKVLDSGRDVKSLRRDGARFETHLEVSEAFIGDERLFVGTFRAISERERSAALLDEFRSLTNLTSVGIFRTDRSGKNVYFNDRAHEIVGLSRETVRTAGSDEALHPDDRERVLEAWTRALETQTPLVSEHRYVHRDGRVVWVTVEATPEIGPAGESLGHVGTVVDITDRKAAEQTLIESEAELRRNEIMARLGGFRVDLLTNEVHWTAGTYRILGIPAATAPSLELVTDVTHPDDRQRLASALTRVRAGQVPDLESKFRVVVDDEVRWLAMRIEVESDAGGQPLSLAGTIEDITERRALEEQLRQSQKMQDIGQLAGGIAHDFNNNINVISGFGELILDDFDPDDPRRADLKQMLAAADRAARLTQQLLAVSRRQVLRPRLLDLGDVVSRMAPMLVRALGEDIELTARPLAGLGAVHADRGQIEQVLLNLAVNARDAMPTGGRLTIELSNAELDASQVASHPDASPGSCVVLAVSDIGTGMDDATLARIFEPFFTTKAIGKGTGLGLSTSYGIAQQSGGFISVHSEPGEGTTFKVVLPRVSDHVATAVPVPVPVAGSVDDLRGAETILVVDDDEAGRLYVRRVLEARGYRVLDAGSASGALDAWAKLDRKVDLLITDVVMPEMSGPELADRLKSLDAGFRVLFISGYAEEAIVDRGVVDPDVAFLSKPFSPSALARKIRAIIDDDHPHGAG